MALDTRSKRASSVQVLAPYILSPVLPDGSLGAGDRAHIAWNYAATAAAPGATTWTKLTLTSTSWSKASATSTAWNKIIRALGTYSGALGMVELGGAADHPALGELGGPGSLWTKPVASSANWTKRTPTTTTWT